MRIPTPIQALSAAAALALLAGCSSGSAVAPSMSTTQSHHSVQMLSGRVPSVLNPVGMLRLHNLGGFQPDHKASWNACPAAGTIIYMSDFNTSDVNIYKGGNTSPLVLCGQLTGFTNPQGLMVKAGNLYVSNTDAENVEAFHRGSTSPFKTYTDTSCSGEFPADVTVSSDNVVYATNIISGACAGSISAWNKTSGNLIANIPNPNGANSYFLTIQNNGQLYFDDNTFGLYTAMCTGGSCGTFANVGATMNFPGGLRSEDGEDVALDDQSGPGGGNLYTYEPPTFNVNNTNCPVNGVDPVSFDVNHSQHHAFFADAGLNQLTELKYTNTTGACAAKGTVAGNQSGLPIGVGVDRAEVLK